MNWLTVYRVLQGTEFESNLGGWIADAKPTLGPAMTAGVESVKKLDRTRIGESVGLREHFARRLNAALAAGDMLCLPTAPTVAPLKGSNAYDRSNDYYWRTLSINAIAGIGRLPQVSMPLGQVDGAPVGLSLVAAHGRDLELLASRDAHLKAVARISWTVTISWPGLRLCCDPVVADDRGKRARPACLMTPTFPP